MALKLGQYSLAFYRGLPWWNAIRQVKLKWLHYQLGRSVDQPDLALGRHDVLAGQRHDLVSR